jgi:dTDP-4-dehydrorhamnose reductase
VNEELETDLLELATAIETACYDFKQKIAQKHGITDQQAPAVSEANFNLNFTEAHTQKLGTFEVTEEKANPPQKWNRALNILKQTNATISSRYHDDNYSFSYWLYNERIYRQKLKR